MKISFLLAGEGSSDLRLVGHIEDILICEGFSEVSGEAPDLGLFPKAVGRTVKDKLSVLVQAFPNTDVIFMHRDADGAGAEVRVEEILRAGDGIFERNKIIPVVPVTMLETWLLADIDAIKRIAGGSGLGARLNCHPGVGRLEGVRDAKGLLLSALCEASQAQGGRLKKFKRRFSEMRARLAQDLDPEGPVNQLRSYTDFRKYVADFSSSYLGL